MEINTKEEAIQYAKDWQIWQADQSLSYKDILNYQDFFSNLADRFGIREEFEENGII